MSKPVIRLALREEGNFWNAYVAKPGTMDGALLIGAIRMKAVTGNVARKNAFLEMMRSGVNDMLVETFGSEVAWPEGPRPAPENERSGHA